MAIEIKVPVLGESLVDAVVGQWLKAEGEEVSQGETILELETDKVNLDVTAEAEANSPIADQVEAADDAQVDAAEETAEAVSEDTTHAEGEHADKA